MRRILLIYISLLMVTCAYSQIGVGTINPDPSSMLHIDVTELPANGKKGFLGPRVALESATDQTTIPNPATGLLIYNLGTAGLTYTGYAYWDGSKWAAFNSISLTPGTITGITCNNITFSPSTYTQGTPYNGTMTVPYIGGNGGTYAGQTIGPINGLSAILQPGNFNTGSGSLTFTVTGTPTVSSPTSTSFPINVGGQACNAVVGAGDAVALGELVYYKTGNIPANIGGGGPSGDIAGNWLNAADSSDLPVLGGKIRLDGYFSSSSGATGVSFNPRLVNISSSPVKIWFSAITTVDAGNAANLVLAANGGWVNLDNGIYLNLGYNHLTSGGGQVSVPGVVSNNHQEVLTMDISLDDKWYRVYYFPNVDNNDTSSAADDFRRIYISIQRLH